VVVACVCGVAVDFSVDFEAEDAVVEFAAVDVAVNVDVAVAVAVAVAVSGDGLRFFRFVFDGRFLFDCDWCGCYGGCFWKAVGLEL